MSFIQIVILIVVLIVVFAIGKVAMQGKRGKNLNEHVNSISGFKADYTLLDHNKYQILALDKSGRLLLSEAMLGAEPKDRFIDFKDIIEVEVQTNNTTVSKVSMTGAVVGGAIAGGIGAIIGSQSGKSSKEKIKSITLKINTKDFDNPVIVHPLFESDDDKGTDPSSILLQEPIANADKWEGMFKIILEENKQS